MICIYKITSKIDNKSYIGQTADFNNRIKNHLASLEKGSHFNQHLQNAYKKYGLSNFVIEVLAQCSKENLDELEVHFIKKHQTTNRKFGYNMMYGGQSNRRFFTDEVRKKMSDSSKGRKFSESHKENIRKANVGKIISKEAIEKTRQTKIRNGSHKGERNVNALLSNKEAEEIILLLLGGVKVNEVAELKNIKANSIYNLILNRSFTNVLPHLRQTLKERFATNQSQKENEALKMYLNGTSQNEIASSLNISRNTVRRLLKDNGIKTDLHKNQFIYANTEINKHIS